MRVVALWNRCRFACSGADASMSPHVACDAYHTNIATHRLVHTMNVATADAGGQQQQEVRAACEEGRAACQPLTPLALDFREI